MIKKLCLGILFLAMPIFVLSLGVLFIQSRQMIRNEAVGRANSVLSATMQRIYRNILTIENATNANSWLITHYLDPDSLLALSRRIVSLNPHIDGCSISTEPYVFPEYGRYFSAYTIRTANGSKKVSEITTDSIITVVEQEYEYFTKIWYRSPRDYGHPCWEAYFDESDSLDVTLNSLIASYGQPIYDSTGRFIAVISTDLSLLRLSKIVTAEEKPYTNSYFMMIDKEGHYFIHPDSTRLFTHTIFEGVDPRSQSDLITLGHEMTASKQGSMAVVIDDVPSLVCYQPVPGTSWSLALVCPDSDILSGYYRQTYIVVPLLIIGLFVILLLCYRSVTHAIRPLNQLLLKTQSIAEGNMEVHIPRSQREDVIGRLQNSFATMLQSLNIHMGSVRYTTELTRRQNEELEKATILAKEADRQKSAFIQNVTHQIRTPLNIIMGFAQVLRGSVGKDSQLSGEDLQTLGLSDEEMRSITNTMEHNSKLLNRMVKMLFDSSETGLNEELLSDTEHDVVSCNKIAREATNYVKLQFPDLRFTFHTEVDDDLQIHTSSLYLMRTLRELLYNSAKYSDGQNVSLSVSVGEDLQHPTVRFIVQDTGKGISETYYDLMFKFFNKIDDLSEGLGLGLPLAKRHATNLGGDLTLDTNYHKGCRFILELPIQS